MDIIYLVEFLRYYYKDDTDNEDVEDRYTIGYFNSSKLAYKAIKECLEYDEKLNEKDFLITELNFKYTKKQKYLYVLNYEYSIINDENLYEDFYYKYPPCKNKKECKEQKKIITNSKSFFKKENAIHDISKDGFYIDKILINFTNKIKL